MGLHLLGQLAGQFHRLHTGFEGAAERTLHQLLQFQFEPCLERSSRSAPQSGRRLPFHCPVDMRTQMLRDARPEACGRPPCATEVAADCQPPCETPDHLVILCAWEESLGPRVSVFSCPSFADRHQIALAQPGGGRLHRDEIARRSWCAAGSPPAPALLVLILLIFGIKGCLDSRKDRAYRDYASDVNAIVGRVQQPRPTPLFETLSPPQERRGA